MKKKLSTKKIPQSETETIQDFLPPIEPKCNKVYISLYEETNRIHTDQTSKFPIKSLWGYNYILIAYVYDTNTILYRPIKSKEAKEIQSVYTNLYNILQK